MVAAQIHRARGLLQARSGELEDAEALLAQAVEIGRAAGDPFALARTLLDYGGTLLALGRGLESESALNEARSLFHDLGAVAWLERMNRAQTETFPARATSTR
jgi:tetratricopeptide (TPR) repeat protein